MKSPFLPPTGQLRLTDIAARLQRAPAILGVDSTIRLNVVAYRQAEEWVHFAARAAIGLPDTDKQPPLVTANELKLVRITTNIADVRGVAPFRAFLQSWRRRLDPKATVFGFQDRANVYWHPARLTGYSVPHWRLTLSEKRPETSSTHPIGPFSNHKAAFFAKTVGEAAVKWLRDPMIQEYGGPRQGIELLVFDPRAYITSVSREGDFVRVNVTQNIPIRLFCRCEFTSDNSAQKAQSVEVIGGIADVPIPTDAPWLELFLVGTDNTCYDRDRISLMSDRDRLAKRTSLEDAVDGGSQLPTPVAADDEPSLSEPETKILAALDSLHHELANCYRQLLYDLSDISRVSWRGTAGELREVVRGVLDRLAPRDLVSASTDFKIEPNTKGPTMAQQVRFILNTKNLDKAAMRPAKKATAIITESIAVLSRAVYDEASGPAHSTSGRSEVLRVKSYADALLAELLDAH